MQVRGIIPPMCTPLTDEGRIDTTTLRRFVEFLEEGGVHGLFPCSTTGEFTSLDPEQRRTMIETVVDATESLPVCAGCGDTNVSSVVDQITVAKECGADIAIVIVPYYLPSTEAGMHDFFAEIASEAALPIFIYNLPELVGYGLSIREMEQMAEHENIVGLKDTTEDMLRCHRLLTRLPNSFSVFQGAGTLTYPSLEMGCEGVVAGSANVCPGLVSDVFDFHHSGDKERAQDLMYDKIFPLIDLINKHPPLSSTKFLVGESGPDLGPPSPPLPTLDAEQKDDLRTSFAAIDC